MSQPAGHSDTKLLTSNCCTYLVSYAYMSMLMPIIQRFCGPQLATSSYVLLVRPWPSRTECIEMPSAGQVVGRRKAVIVTAMHV
jgi:hypothetical protein